MVKPLLISKLVLLLLSILDLSRFIQSISYYSMDSSDNFSRLYKLNTARTIEAIFLVNFYIA